MNLRILKYLSNFFQLILAYLLILNLNYEKILIYKIILLLIYWYIHNNYYDNFKTLLEMKRK